MKILQIHNFYRIRAGECAVVAAERELLERHGHEVTGFYRDNRETEHYSILRKAVSLVQIPRNLGVARELSALLQSYRPDVAHVHNVFPLLSPSIYGVLKTFRVPVVQTMHNFRFLCPNAIFFVRGAVCEECQTRGFLSAVRKRCVQRDPLASLAYAVAVGSAWRFGLLPDGIDRYVALNQFSKDKLMNAGVPAERIEICGNFIEARASNLMPKQRYVLYLGRLDAEKGLRTLLRAWGQVRGLTLRIAGTGPLEREIREAAAKSTTIEFVGFVKGAEKERLVREALCMVVPSEWYENFPMSVLESLSLGTPVVASRIGGLPEMIDPGETGLLFTPGHAEELARCLMWFAERIHASERLGANAMSRARERHGPETHYARLMNIYTRARSMVDTA